MNADGSGKVRLTNNTAIDNAAAWSPDASRLAFTSTGTASGSFQIYVMSAVGSDVMPLTNTPSNLEPSWSPDGRQIAFTSTREFNLEISVMNADGSGQTRLTTDPAGDLQPSWSPAAPAARGMLAFATQPPETVDVDVAISPPVRIAIQDSLGNPIAGATDTVTLALTVNGAGAILLGTTTVAAMDGIATFGDLRVDRPGRGYTLVATAPGLTDATSASFGASHLSFATVSAGLSHSCGVTTRGAAFCWGYNYWGGLGDGTTTHRATPVPVSGGLSLSAVSAGSLHTCGVTTSQDAYCWGYNWDGELGEGAVFPHWFTSPVAVAGGVKFALVSAGRLHTCGLAANGDAYCWGDNYWGATGDTTTFRSSPGRIVSELRVTIVSAGGDHTCGVTTTSHAWCWGRNLEGQGGDPATVSWFPPRPVVSTLPFVAVSAGGLHTCGVGTDGAGYCWGDNTTGQLGDGTTTGRGSLDPVVGGLRFTAVSAGRRHSCGVTTSGNAYCWGDNSSRQLGDGTTSGPVSPVPVAGALTFAAVTPGGDHTGGATPSGGVYCWGDNLFGQLGNRR